MATRVLIIDDDADTVDVLGELLGREGFEVATSTSGPAAIEFARRALPDVVVLDLAMPRFTGIDVLKALKADRRTRGSAVLVVTGAGRDDQAAALAAGAVECFVKPTSLDVDGALDLMGPPRRLTMATYGDVEVHDHRHVAAAR